MRNVASSAVSGGDPTAIIEQLKQRKAERQAQNQQRIEKLLNASAQVYGFAARGFLPEVSVLMNKNIPNASHIFTACICFIGDDLSNIRGMMKDVTE